MPHDVFISYSAKDRTVAQSVCVKLEDAGISCWIAPRNIDPGKPWAAEIVAAVKASRVFVLIFTESANRSPQILRETQKAADHGVSIVPLRLERVPVSEGLDYYIGPVHWLEATSSPLARHLDHLVATCLTLLPNVQPVKGGAATKGIPLPLDDSPWLPAIEKPTSPRPKLTKDSTFRWS